MNSVFLSILLIAFSLTMQAEEALQQTSEQELRELYTKPIEEPGSVMFTPPEGWGLVDPKDPKFPRGINAMVIGKGKGAIPPAISLKVDPFPGTLKDYLKKVKAIHDSHGEEWKDLGPIQTEAGTANLSQADINTQWGKIRAMIVIFVKDGNAYILTTSALRDEFTQFYPQFFAVMRSLRMNKTVNETDSTRKMESINMPSQEVKEVIR